MRTEIYAIGRTSRTIVYDIYYKHIRHTVILWADGSSESRFCYINQN